MSQYYPQQGPIYPPEFTPEEDDYYEDGDYEYYDDIGDDDSESNPLFQPIMAFLGGGCLVFLCMSVCAFLLGVLWIVDPGGGQSAESVPGSEIGISFDEPAFPGESVVNEENMQVTILDVNRNAAVETIPQAEGREIIITTVEVVNLGEADRTFNERDFVLLNALEEAYLPAIGAVEGALGRGSLPPGEGLEGRLVFEVIAGEFDLVLLWEPGGEAQPRYLWLE
jgi:hypothetical protein